MPEISDIELDSFRVLKDENVKREILKMKLDDAMQGMPDIEKL